MKYLSRWGFQAVGELKNKTMKIKLAPVIGFLAVLVALTCSTPMSVSAEELDTAVVQEYSEGIESSAYFDVVVDSEQDSEEQMQTEWTETPYGGYSTIKVVGSTDAANVKKMLNMVNDYRVSQGYGTLVLDKKLTQAAMARAEEISVYFDHTRPNGSYGTVLPNYGTENISGGYASMESAFAGWVKSPGHRINLLTSYNKYIGVGQFNDFYVIVMSSDDRWTEKPTDEYINSFNAKDTVRSVVYSTNERVPFKETIYNFQSITIDRGKTDKVDYAVTPAAQSGAEFIKTIVDPSSITWASSNTKVASVNSVGIVTGLNAGTSSITGTLDGHTLTYNFTVTNNGTPVQQMNGLSLTPSPISLEINKTTQLMAAKLPLNCVNSDTITYTSLDPTVATVDSNGKVTAIKQGSTTITAKCGSYSAQANVNVLSANFGVSYRTHVQNVGWQDYVRDGLMSGTEARSLRLEGINIKTDPTVSGGITYRTHVQNIGWQGWKSNDQMSGTEGMSYRLEGIEIKLTGDLATKYDVYYRVHTQNIGWMGWAKNGESSGSAGFSYRLEGIQIQLVAKGAPAPGSTVKPFVENK